MSDNESTMAIVNDPDFNEWLHEFVRNKPQEEDRVSESENE